MDDYSGLFEEKEAPRAPLLSPEEFKAKKMAEREALNQATLTAISNVFANAGEFESYLNICARFPGYSYRNKALINRHFPEATKLKSFDDWKNEEIRIKKGEKSRLQIWGRVEVKGKEYIQPTNVFDISQTDAAPVNRPVYESKNILAAFSRNAQKQFNVGMKMVGDEDFYKVEDDDVCSYDADSNTIYCQRTISREDFLINLVQELAYVIAMRYNKKPFRVPADEINSQNEDSVEVLTAGSVAFILKERYGINTEFDLAGIEELFPTVKQSTDPQKRYENYENCLSQIDYITRKISNHIEINLKEKGKELANEK